MKSNINLVKLNSQAEFLYNRLVKRYTHLRKWARRIDTNTFRLYDRDIPEIPLVLDLYGDFISGALYKRPYEKDEGEEILWLEAMQEAISKALKISESHIFLKTRQRQKGKSQYNARHKETSSVWKEVREGGLVFKVNLSDYLDTGLFLDARKRRAHIQSEAKGKKVLNLFSYTCSQSVYAAAGGALEVDSVDMSRTYLEWGGINLKLNGFSTLSMDERDFFSKYSRAKSHKLIRADTLSFLPEAAKARLSWDLIILDPPSFSNSKKMKTHLDINRDYKTLIKDCIKLLSPKGKLYFSTNAQKFRLESTTFPNLIIQNLTEELRDEDFKGKKTSSCWLLTSSHLYT